MIVEHEYKESEDAVARKFARGIEVECIVCDPERHRPSKEHIQNDFVRKVGAASTTFVDDLTDQSAQLVLR